MSPTPEPTPPQRPPPPRPFGIRLETNGDVLKAGAALVAVGFGVKYSIQALGVPDIKAGQLTTGFLSVASLLAWISTYFFRVGTKSMTYVQQLKDYEDAVIEKRYEELTPEELAALAEEMEDEKSS